jgi:alkylated DNA repair dioxygenase AlkB
MGQLSFLSPEEKPPGLSYYPEFITPAEETFFLSEFKKLELKPFEFMSYIAKRNVLSFRNSYEFGKKKLHEAAPSPEWLKPLLHRAAKTLHISEERISQILVTHYPIGAPIGWHRDAPSFEHLLGITLGSECTMKMREMSGKRKYSLHLERRSAYAITGHARWRWEHHIPPVKEERYSLTFRSLVSENPVSDHEL